MGLNYFAIMGAADKEMIHSAMLRFLLHNVPPVLALFAPFARRDELRIGLEEKAGRGRFDLVARSGEGDLEQTLVVENKFKSYPTVGQLSRYDAALENTRGLSKFLLCFDSGALCGNGGNTLTAPRGSAPWGVITYREIKEKLDEWVDGAGGKAASSEARSLCRHYTKYLAEYYETFDKVRENYGLALCEDASQKVCRESMNACPELDARDVANVAGAPNFWQTLVLHEVGLLLEKRLLKECGSAAGKARDEERLVIHSMGGSSTPNMDIQPPHWPGGNDGPLVCIQVQGKEMKLYVKDLNKLGATRSGGSSKAQAPREAILGYAEQVRGMFSAAGAKGVAGKKGMQTYASKFNSFFIYKEELPTNGTPMDVAALTDRIWAFYKRMDEALAGVRAPDCLPVRSRQGGSAVS